MNSKNKLLLELLERVNKGEQVLVADLKGSEVYEYIQNRFRLFNYFTSNTKEEGLFDIDWNNEITELSPGSQDGYLIWNGEKNVRYPKHLVKLHRLTKKGHEVLDDLYDKRRDELLANVSKNQQELMESQAKTLKNTFWVYVLLAGVTLVQVTLIFISTFIEMTRYVAIFSFTLLVAAYYGGFWILTQFDEIPITKGASWRYFLAMVGLAILVGVIGYGSEQFAWAGSEQAISGTIHWQGNQTNFTGVVS